MDIAQIVKLIEFWKQSAENVTLRDRTILQDIDLNSKEIVDLTGPRRSGKSSILKLIIRHLNLKDNFLFINFEDPFFIEYKTPQIIEEIIEVYREFFSPTLKYLFFDEIQRINEWERAIRKLRDCEQYKIFITGSSSKLLSSEISTLLTGRHLSYSIYPLSFSEYLTFKKLNLKHKRDIISKRNLLLKHFDAYLKKGGFPEVVLSGNCELLQNYFSDIVQKDIIMRYDVREKEILEKIAVFLITNSSKIGSIKSLKETFNISFALASSYVEYIKEALLVFSLTQFSYSLKKQQKSQKKFYAVDPGLAGAVSFRFSEDKGRILENIVYLHIRRCYKNFFYYRTKNHLEVDFFIHEKSGQKHLIQVSWSLNDAKTKQREIRALTAAMDELKIPRGVILTFNEEDKISISDKEILIKPVYLWILEDERQ